MDDLLLRIAVNRDREAFAELRDVYAGPLRTYMLRNGADQGAADGLVAETFAAVWEEAPAWPERGGSAVTFVFRIARDLRIRRLRNEKAWHPKKQLPAGQDGAETGSQRALGGSVVDPDETERRKLIARVISQLPPDQSEMVRLTYEFGLSMGEIAERSETPLGTVKANLRAAYAKIREALEDKGTDGD